MKTIGSVNQQRRLISFGLALLPTLSFAVTEKPVITMWRGPKCGCCKDWAAYLEKNGFNVKAIDIGNTEMRQKLRQHHGEQSTEVKHASGGIVDLEFISQYLVLGYAAEHAQLYRYSDNIRILDAAADCGLLQAQQVQELQQAYQLLRGAGHRQTLAPAKLPEQDSLTQAKQVVEQSWRQLFSQS